MKILLIALELLFFAAMAGCVGDTLNHYDSVKEPKAESLPDYKSVRFDVFAMEIPQESTSETTIASLSAAGQAEAVKILGAKYAKPEDFLASLAKPLETTAPPDSSVRSRFKRRIVIQVVDLPLLPADRLDQAIIHLSLQGAQFLSWDKFTTNHETIDLGTVTSTRSLTGTASLKATDPSGQAEADAQLQYTRSLEKEKNLSRRFAAATAVLSGNEATIALTGNDATRLTDNITVDTEIEVADFKGIEFGFFETSPLFKNSQALSPGKVSLKPRRSVQLAALQQLPIKVKAKMDYIVRHVIDGGDTMDEGDDDIELKPGSTDWVERVLVSEKEGKANTFGLSLGADGLVFVAGQDDRKQPLKFQNYSQALELKKWLIEVYGKGRPDARVVIGRQPLFIGKSETPLRGGDVGRISVQ